MFLNLLHCCHHNNNNLRFSYTWNISSVILSCGCQLSLLGTLPAHCPLPTWRPVFPFPSFQLSRHSSCFTYGNDILWDQVYFWNSIWQQGNISMVRAGNSRVPFISPCFISSCSTTFTHGNDILWDQVYLWNNIWQQGSTYKHGLCG